MKIFKFYSIKGKVLIINFDNAPVNTATINMLKINLKPPYGGEFFINVVLVIL